MYTDSVPTAVLLLGHGSRAQNANEGMYQVVSKLREKWPEWSVNAAFLEINSPSIPEGIDLCVSAGAEKVILMPYFLHLGAHVQRDLPAFVREGRIRHRGVEIILSPHLGFHPKLVEIAAERITAALGSCLAVSNG